MEEEKNTNKRRNTLCIRRFIDTKIIFIDESNTILTDGTHTAAILWKRN